MGTVLGTIFSKLLDPCTSHSRREQTSADSAATVASLPGPAGRIFGRKKKSMTTIDSRKRVAGTDSDFEFDVGETVHLQGSARTFLSIALLLSASLCPTATPASTDPATSTWTNSRNPRSRWPKIQGRSGHRERLRIRRRWLSRQTFPSFAAPQFSAAWVRHRHGGRSLPERRLRSAEASRSRPAQLQLGSRASLLPAPVEWAKLRRTLPPERRTQWSNGHWKY